MALFIVSLLANIKFFVRLFSYEVSENSRCSCIFHCVVFLVSDLPDEDFFD